MKGISADAAPVTRLIVWSSLLVLAACQPQSTPRSSENEIPADVRSHLKDLIAVAEQHSVRRADLDWSLVTSQVLHAAENTSDPVHDGVSMLLRILADGHSFYVPANERWGERLTAHAACDVTEPEISSIPAVVGYVSVPGSSRPPMEDASEILQQIRTFEGQQIRGWIVDLRGNRGGNMWSMISGLSPLMGESNAGWFVFPDGTRESWGAPVNSAHELGLDISAPDLTRQARVAVLTDRSTASSGEAIAVAFRGGPDTRSFGAPTCGKSSANKPFPMPNGAVLYLTTARLADRTGAVYEGPIVPDEEVADHEVVGRAVEWLLSGEPE